MSKISVINTEGEKVKDLTLKKEIWAIEPNDTVLYDALRLATSSIRQGTHSTKTRAEVRGGGRKPWRQKGSGRARQGSIRSPQWAGGGIVFGPKPRDYDKKMNRKERRLALKSALSYKAKEKELIVIDSFDVKTPKTKDMIKQLEKIGVSGRVLIVVEELTDNLILGTRNLEKVNLIQATELNPYDVVNCRQLVVTEGAVKIIEEVLNLC